MLRVLLQASVICLFAFALSVAGLSAWRSFHQQAEQAGDEPGAKEAQKKSVDTSPRVEPKETADDAIARYNLWLMVFTGALAFVALLQIGFMFSADTTATKAAKAAQDSADAAKIGAQVASDSLIASKRPWVYAVEINPSKPTLVDSGRFLIPLVIKMKNTGRTPAIDVWPVVEAMDVSIADTTPTDRLNTIISYGPLNQVGIALFPDASFDAEVYARMDQQETALALKRTDKTIWPWIIGCIFYRFEPGGEVHHTGFILNTYVTRNDPKDYLININIPAGPPKLTLKLSPQGSIAN